MKNECKIVEDLLPVYVEDLCQAETAEFVSEHISGCKDCAGKYSDMKKPASVEKVDRKKLAAAKRPLHKVVVDTVLKTLGGIVVAIILISSIIYGVVVNGFEIVGLSSGRIEFFTDAYVDKAGNDGKPKVVKTYTENGEALDMGDNRIRFESIGSFRYKNYYVSAESVNGSWAVAWKDKDLLMNNSESDYRYEPINGSDTYVHVSDILFEDNYSLASLKDKDRRKIEGAACALASIDEVATKFAIEEYRDVFTEQVNIWGTIQEYHENESMKFDDTVTLHFVGTGTGKDGKAVNVDDTLVFDISGWKNGVTPTYTITKNRT